MIIVGLLTLQETNLLTSFHYLCCQFVRFLLILPFSMFPFQTMWTKAISKTAIRLPETRFSYVFWKARDEVVEDLQPLWILHRFCFPTIWQAFLFVWNSLCTNHGLIRKFLFFGTTPWIWSHSHSGFYHMTSRFPVRAMAIIRWSESVWKMSIPQISLTGEWGDIMGEEQSTILQTCKKI